jgi:hypothetical protein
MLVQEHDVEAHHALECRWSATDCLPCLWLLGLQVSQPLVPLVDEFAAKLFSELDYVAEGKNAERFQVIGCRVHGWMMWGEPCSLSGRVQVAPA